MIFSIWDNEIEKKEKQKKWTDNFRKIGEEVYTFFVDTVIEKGYENREGQWDMSCEITDAMKRKQHILVEAGVEQICQICGIKLSRVKNLPIIEEFREGMRRFM